MARIIALLDDPTARARLREALRQERVEGAMHDMRFAADAAELEGWCELGEIHAAIFDPFSPTAPDTEFWGALHARFPAVALLVYADLALRAASRCEWLRRAGIHEVVVLSEEDSPYGLRERLTRGLLLPLYGAILPEVQEIFPAHLSRYAERLLRESYLPLTAAEAATLDFRSERTLRRQLACAGLPTLSKLAIWFRLLHAAHLLDDPGRTVSNVARALHFASGNALHNQIARHVACGAGLLRREGARERVWMAFRARCDVARHRGVAGTV